MLVCVCVFVFFALLCVCISVVVVVVVLVFFSSFFYLLHFVRNKLYIRWKRYRHIRHWWHRHSQYRHRHSAQPLAPPTCACGAWVPVLLEWPRQRPGSRSLYKEKLLSDVLRYCKSMHAHASKQASKLILLASKTIHSDNYQIIQILCDAKWRGW